MRAAEVVASVEGQLRLAASGGDEDAKAATSMIHETVDDNPTVSALMLLNPNQQMGETLLGAYNKLGDNIGLTVADASDYHKIFGRANSVSGAGEAVSEVRRKITAIADSAGTATGPATAAIIGAYEDLYRDNRIGNVSSVFSESASAEFRKTGGAAALLRDLMRHDIATSLSQIENETAPATAADIREDVASVFNRAIAVYGVRMHHPCRRVCACSPPTAASMCAAGATPPTRSTRPRSTSSTPATSSTTQPPSRLSQEAPSLRTLQQARPERVDQARRIRGRVPQGADPGSRVSW